MKETESLSIDQMRDALTEYEIELIQSLPLCSDLERWARPSTWAVKKTANKRAMRVFDSEAEAEKYFKEKNLDNKHSIEERIGKNIRCEADYCGVARWCDQFEAIKNGSL